MTPIRSVALFPAMFALSLIPAAPHAAAPDRLLQRQRPLVVRWGEVEVTETALVKLAPAGGDAVPPGATDGGEPARPRPAGRGDVTYPNAVGLVFKGRLREEEMRGLLDGTSRARSHATVAGSLYLAARMDGGRHAWEVFTGKLEEAAGRSTPAGYEEFLSNAANVLSGAASPDVGEFALTFCVVRPGEEDLAGEIHRTIQRTEKGSSTSTGSSTYRKAGTSCNALREAFQGRPPIEVLTTGFTVDESLEETLDLVVESRLTQPPVSMPEGARTSREDPPEGSSKFSSVSNNDGAAHGEMLRRDAGGSGEGREGAYVMTVDLRDAALPRDLPRGRSVLARWDIALRDTRLGAPPHGVAEERQALMMGVFCTTEACMPDLDAFRDATIAKLDAAEGLMTAGQVRSAMDVSSLPADAFTVFCLPGAESRTSATWCLSNVCVKVLNPDPVCDDIAGALPQ